MVRNISLTVELVFMDEDEGCDQRVSICFSVCQVQRKDQWLRKLDVKSCSHLLTVELSRLCSPFTVRPHVWVLYISTGLTMTLQSFTQTCSLILFFLTQMLRRLFRAGVEGCFLCSMSSWSPINEQSFFVMRFSSFFFSPLFKTVCSVLVSLICRLNSAKG